MKFKHHGAIEGHALLSPSKYHWINYSEEQLEKFFYSSNSAQRGTRLHALACECITLNIKLPKNNKSLNAFVNDAIGFKMTPEQILFYSYNCFGTADAISFKKNLLRIHDYKSGVIPASNKQLEIYTALFCLEYNQNPESINIETRIYQNDEIYVHIPKIEDIQNIMQTIIKFDLEIEKLKANI